MRVINIVKSYPEIFGDTPDSIDEDEAWRILASVKRYGSNIQNNVVSIHDKFKVVNNLLN